MTSIAERREPLDLADGGEAAWRRWAGRLRAWLRQQGWALHDPAVSDAVVLLPFAAHLSLARRAWAQTGGGWMPRMETTRTLLDRIAWPAPPAVGGLCGDPVTDRLVARAMLLREAWARDWQRRDARGFEQALVRVVDTAQAVWRARAAVAPADRPGFDARAREAIPPGMGPGARERALAAWAVEWAAATATPASDALFAHRAPAWIAMSAVALEPLVAARLQTALDEGVPVLWLDAAAGLDATPPPPGTRLDLAVALDAEQEAQWAAARILHVLNEPCAESQGCVPVALVAQDRGLVRRVEALLARHGVAVSDETGWKLSTTHAAAALMALVKACRPRASMDELLDALKSGWLQSLPATAADGAPDEPPRAAGPLALDALERLARRRGWVRAWPAEPPRDAGAAGGDAAALELWEQARRQLAAWGAQWSGRISLAEAQGRLRDLLQRSGAWAELQADEAGRRIVEALRLDESLRDAHWLDAAQAWRVDLEAFIRWIDEVLEDTSFTPVLMAQPDVVVTPMARAVLRPFRAVVWPGVDDEHLGEPSVVPGLLGEAAAAALGLPTRAASREQQWTAFRLLMRGPRLHLSWRHADGDRPLGPSPLLERWRLDHGGAAMAEAGDPMSRQARVAQLQPPPLPRWQAVSLPARLHATAYEALRACPYRFHAERLLGLGEIQELEEGLDARDYGTWLHAVLRRFHAEEPAGEVAYADELRRLRRIAEAVTHEQGWDGEASRATFLPYAVAFERVAEAYLQWWQAERGRGAQVARMEQSIDVRLPELAELGMVMTGQLDRVDSVAGSAETDGRRAWRIVDYKTTRAQALRDRMKPLTEDTQLAFYAALLDREPAAGGAPRRELQAAYLSLEDRKVTVVPHAEVRASAAALLEGVVEDMTRIANGAPLAALGEGQACDWCRVRGLCRRDHWEQGRSPLPTIPAADAGRPTEA